VSAAYASARGRGLIDREPYIPKDWFTDRDRCRGAGIPDEVDFVTKPELARRMIARAFAAKLPFAWVTADEAYGQVGRLRLWLEEHHLSYVLAVPKSQMVISMDLGQRRAHTVIADLAQGDWQHLSCGDGAHGQRLYDWAAVDIRPWRKPGYGTGYLPAARSPTPTRSPLPLLRRRRHRPGRVGPRRRTAVDHRGKLVRHEALGRIPGLTGRNLEGGFWV
jgi:DDE superfamily endonuclease